MLYDYLIFYTLDGVSREFLATARCSLVARVNLLRYVRSELGRPFHAVTDIVCEFEGPSAFQF